MFKKAPLPFVGNKHKYVKYITKYTIPYLKKNNIINDDTIIVDVFGGSGILSHVFAYNLPNNQIVYNDYDNYTKYLKPENIKKFNKVLSYIRNIFNSLHTELIDDPKIINHIINKIKSEFPNFEGTYIEQLFNLNLTFHGQSSFHKVKQLNYHRKRTTDYSSDVYDKYILPNIKITHLDYNEIFDEFKKYKNIFYIIDPPYYDTDIKSYSDNLESDESIKVLKFAATHNSLYFESTKFKLNKIIKELKQKYNISVKDHRILAKNKYTIQSNNTDYMILFH